MPDEGHVANNRRRGGERRDRCERSAPYRASSSSRCPRRPDFQCRLLRRTPCTMHVTRAPIRCSTPMNSTSPCTECDLSPLIRTTPPNQRCRRREIARTRRVGLDRKPLARDTTGPARHYNQVAVAGALHAPRLHQPQCHVNKWSRRLADLCGAASPNFQIAAGIQHRRYELRRYPRVERGLAAFETGRASYRRSPADNCCRARCRYWRRDAASRRAAVPIGRLAHPLVARQFEIAPAQGSHSRQKSHHSAGAADENLTAMTRNNSAATTNRDSAVSLVRLNDKSHRAERIGHVAGVVAQKRRIDYRASLRHRREQPIARFVMLLEPGTLTVASSGRSGGIISI